ncbi:MAG: dynamin family protein [Scytonematopsis contorta HA4267-MV1]|jgi:replication fork clamp-binding protein CrfC|nr:dynamin family protein [Scytonematopsis contorta HA4267-MV1]
MNENYKKLLNALKSASILLQLDTHSSLYRDVNSISTYLANPNFRIAVFGPFNHGKSTLLNAILGSRALPIDLIPTTGAAITVKYGSDLRSRVVLSDGTEIYRSGTDVLKQFAILDGDRRMRNDVTSVEVFCPHSLLDRGVEFVDLPGTNDREEQDNLVKEQLLSADLVIQLLDARKLMTLGEREHLRDWLLERGIKTVIFVVNFLNLLEPGEQKEVYNRLLFVAESFRSELPRGYSNLYRVDALPALRARLKGDVAEAASSGLATFETALQNITGILKQNQVGVSSPRVQAIALQLQKALKIKFDSINPEIKAFDDKHNAKIEIKKRAEKIIKQGFNASISKLRDWLNIENLKTKYQSDATVALVQDNFHSWEKDVLKKELSDLKVDIINWLSQAYEFFQQARPEDLLIYFPSTPRITLPPKPSGTEDLGDAGSLAVGSGIGWLLGGPVGAAVVGSVSYLLNKQLQKQEENTVNDSYHQQVAKICIDAMDNYLSDFSRQALLVLDEYERKANGVIYFQVDKEPLEITQKRDELERLQYGLHYLNQQLETTLKITIPEELKVEAPTPRSTTNTHAVYRQQGAGVKEHLGTKTIKNPPPSPSPSSPFSPSSLPTPPSSPTPHSPLSVPKKEDLEVKFNAWELDEEMKRMKAEMSVPGYKIPKANQKQNQNFNQNQNQNPNQNQNQNQTNKAPKQGKKQSELEKIASAYAILGLKDGASAAELKNTYRHLVKQWHPDLFVNQPEMLKKAQEKMRTVNQAYAILSEIL